MYESFQKLNNVQAYEDNIWVEHGGSLQNNLEKTYKK